MKRLLVLLGLLFCASAARATNAVFISQAGAGTQDGTSCANAKPVTYFNTGANWSGSPTGIQIGPDTTVHLCGTFTAAVANTDMLTTQGAGTSGHQVIILFESGAVLTSPAWLHAINIQNNFITVDGGTNGTIQNTLDGSVGNTSCLGGTCTVQQAITYGVFSTGTNAIVKNLNVTHMCMHTYNLSDNGFYRGNCVAISLRGSADLATQNTLDNASVGVEIANANNAQSTFNTMTAISRFHTVSLGNGTQITGIKINNNDLSDPWIWDAADNFYHHNGVHVFTSTGVPGTGATNMHIYNNYMHGIWGKGATTLDGHVTAGVYINDSGAEGLINTVYVTRNIFSFSQAFPGSYPTNGFISFGPPAPTNSVGANNTMMGVSGGGCWKINDPTGSVQSFNNLCATSSGGNIQGTTPTYPSANIDYNFYPGVPTSNAFTVSAGNVNSWAAWSATPYFLDVHCNSSSVPPGSGANCNPTLASAAIGTNFRLGTGSTAINAAKNLTSFCGTIPELCTGAPSTFGRGGASDGAALPGSGNWDSGAYPFASVGTPVLSFSPNPVAFGNQNTGTTGSINVTITNIGTASEVYSSIALTSVFTNGNSGLSGQCAASGTIAAASNCVVKVNFNPVAVTAYSGTLSMTGTANGSVPLTGTGTNAISIPAVPTGLAASVSGQNVSLTWNVSTGTPTGYLLQRATSSGGPYTQIANVTSGTAFSDNGRPNGTYFYQVAAYNSAGTSAYSTAVSAVVVTAPAATLSPSVLNFGSIVEGATSPALTSTLTNTGNANLVLGSSSAVSLSGPNAADFTISANTCTDSLTVVPSGTCVITVTATPSAPGLRQASVVVVSNDPTGPDSVSLNVTGTSAVNVAPTSLAFGNQMTKKPSSPRTVVFSNNSGSTVTFSSVALTTGTQYAISANSCTATLATGLNCSTSVTFTPTTTGLKTDTLTFTFTGVSIGSPQTVAITGTGKRHGVLRVGAVVNWPSSNKPRVIKTVFKESK